MGRVFSSFCCGLAESAVSVPVGSPELVVGTGTDAAVHALDGGMAVGVDGADNCDVLFTQPDLCESTLVW